MTDMVRQLDTYNIGQTAAWNIRMYCAGWTYPVAPLKQLSVKAPMLFITADFDASTPTEWATFAWKNSSNSALVVRHGDDHTTFNREFVHSHFLIVSNLWQYQGR